ncbi:MAG: hypothetical protein OEY51_14550, partial [Cyclobacteriaceae bacterium]|nr:hypothetical protein [Cyclobacteriaceae bacterium]
MTCAFSLTGFTQYQKSIHFDNIGIDDGLLTDKIFDIKQDHKGFIWIASYNGLDRYDGNKFVHYIPFPNDSTTIPSSLVKKIIIDKARDLWIVTSSGNLAKYNRYYDNFSTLSIHNSSNTPVNITDACEGLDNTLWITTLNGGLISFDKKSGRYDFVPLKEQEVNLLLKVYKAGPNLYLDIGDPSSFLKFNMESRTSSRVRFSFTPEEKKVTFWAKSFHQDSSGILWVGTVGNGLYRLEDDDIAWYSKDNGKLHGNVISSILDYDKENIWVGTDDGGITILSKKGEVVSHLQAEHENPSSISVNNVHCLFKDRQNITWVGTYGGGIDRYDPGKLIFEKVTPNPHDPRTLSDHHVLAFAEDLDGDIWIGTDGGGLNRMVSPGHYEQFLSNKKVEKSLSGNIILNMAVDNKNQLWIGTYGGGISIYNKKTGYFTRHHTEGNMDLRYNAVWDIVKDRKGTIWVGMEEGNVARFDTVLMRYEYMENTSSNKEMLFTRLLYEDSDGVLWCSFLNNGLWKIDKEKRRINKVDLGELNSFSINHIIEDRESRTWMASERFGLVELIKGEKGLSYNIVQILDDPAEILLLRSIEEDEKGFLWLSSDKGIFRFDKKTMKAEHFTMENGLQANQFSFGASLKARDGTIYFGGNNGYSFFDPSKIMNTPDIQNIEITKFTLF